MRSGVHSPTYRSWQMMKNRCLNPRAEDFAYYGGRGITVAPAWLEYDSFLADMGQRPDGMTLERRDGSLGYNDSNCSWATRLTQARNRDYTLDLTFDGRTMKTWEWADELRLKRPSLYIRLWDFRGGRITEAQLFAPNPRATP